MKTLQLNYEDLPAVEKTKIRNCSLWNFYSEECMCCRYKLLCAEQWKIREWFE